MDFTIHLSTDVSIHFSTDISHIGGYDFRAPLDFTCVKKFFISMGVGHGMDIAIDLSTYFSMGISLEGDIEIPLE